MRGPGGADRAGDADARGGLAGPVHLPVRLAEGDLDGVEVLETGELGGGEGDLEDAAAVLVRLDLLRLADVEDLGDGGVHGLLEADGGLVAVELGVAVASGDAVVEPAAVAPGGPVPAELRFEDGDVEEGDGLLEVVGGPQARVAAADDADVRGGVAGERLAGVGGAVLCVPERDAAVDRTHVFSLFRVRGRRLPGALVLWIQAVRRRFPDGARPGFEGACHRRAGRAPGADLVAPEGLSDARTQDPASGRRGRFGRSHRPCGGGLFAGGSACCGGCDGRCRRAGGRALRPAAAVDGTKIVVGEAKASHTVTVYVDPRCGHCAKFEASAGTVLAEEAAAGTVKVEYVVASFLDARTGGTASARAANALRASVDAGPGRFAAFQAALFAAQPGEGAGVGVGVGVGVGEGAGASGGAGGSGAAGGLRGRRRLRGHAATPGPRAASRPSTCCGSRTGWRGCGAPPSTGPHGRTPTGSGWRTPRRPSRPRGWAVRRPFSWTGPRCPVGTPSTTPPNSRRRCATPVSRLVG